MKIIKVTYFLIIMVFAGSFYTSAQQTDSISKTHDTAKGVITRKHDSIPKKKKPDSLAINHFKRLKPANDTIRNVFDTAKPMIQNPIDSLKMDSLQLLNLKDNLITKPDLTNFVTNNITDKLLAINRFINTKDRATFYIEEPRTATGKEFLFYSVCIIVLILGVFKTIFSGYFNNLFRVFFNTSLRQTQLTDQLLQAKLPSFILNIFFTLTAGVFIWLLFTHFNPPRSISSQLLLPFCILSMAAIYFIKYCLLKFTGWVTDIQEITDNYIFVIFLVNKITGILLVPFIVLLAFSRIDWVASITTVSLLLLGLFFLSRYVKSYGLIQKKMPFNPFHFIIYITGAEILPLLILYKIAADYLI